VVDSGLDDGAAPTDLSVDLGLVDDGAARLSSVQPGRDGATDDFFPKNG